METVFNFVGGAYGLILLVGSYILLNILIILINVAIIRWVFRVNKTIELLEQISDKLPNPNQMPHDIQRIVDKLSNIKPPEKGV
jgi:hypothetical protein